MEKKKNSHLGRSLIKARFGNKVHKLNNDSFLHTSELKDGYDWSKLNLRSVTEENSLKEFLSTAELAGTEFTAEKLNVTFINSKRGMGLLTADETIKIKESQDKNKDFLKIPRRPKWDSNTTAEELHTKEKEEFLSWRRNLALFEEESGLLMTPFEKNLDFWRELWRVVERSDVLIQIVDARNPLLFYCEDLEKYVKEVDKNKLNLILCNKSDFLTYEQRRHWAKYFDSINTSVVFFSALKSVEDDEIEEEEHLSESEDSNEPKNFDEANENFKTDEKIIGQETEPETAYHRTRNSAKLLGRSELINFFRSFAHQQRAFVNKDFITIGLVGYPNVGKSSTINSLLMTKKVSVSATPGKTKHIQTIPLDKDIVLCDCPGLVMPSFVSTKADMILNGILPIDHMKDHVPPVNLLCTLIPRHILESKYGIMIPMPEEGEDPNRPPYAEELLNSYAYNRGFMTANGEPDNPRAARCVLKDFVNGKLLYCWAPQSQNQNEFHVFEAATKKNTDFVCPKAMRIIQPFKVATRDLEYSIFKERKNIPNVHIKGLHKFDIHEIQKLEIMKDNQSTGSKPWKNHKEKRNKHEKLRKKYSCLDK